MMLKELEPSTEETLMMVADFLVLKCGSKGMARCMGPRMPMFISRPGCFWAILDTKAEIE